MVLLACLSIMTNFITGRTPWRCSTSNFSTKRKCTRLVVSYYSSLFLLVFPKGPGLLVVPHILYGRISRFLSQSYPQQPIGEAVL